MCIPKDLRYARQFGSHGDDLDSLELSRDRPLKSLARVFGVSEVPPPGHLGSQRPQGVVQGVWVAGKGRPSRLAFELSMLALVCMHMLLCLQS